MNEDHDQILKWNKYSSGMFLFDVSKPVRTAVLE